MFQTQRGDTARMTDWDRRTETQTAKQRRRQTQLSDEKQRLEGLVKEKDNAIEQYIISRDKTVRLNLYNDFIYRLNETRYIIFTY